MSVCCLNPKCDRLLNQDNAKFCQNCKKPIALLRNHYRPIRFLGEGGFGRTFLAEDTEKFNEQCVVKQLVPQVRETWAMQQAQKLFEQEAKKLQKLGEHPQIPRLTAYFEQDNYWYIVQQFVEGQTLYQELEQERIFTEDKIRKVLQELLEILKFIHKDKVIHRDLKPANIMRRSSDRKLVLIDFGIAKELAQTTLPARSLNPTGTRMIGSFGYSPLEQMEGGRVYPASDLYSLGATCFHLLSGIHPYKLWREYGYGWITDWQKHIQTPISQSLVRILTKLLQKDYQQRYQNAEEVLADLNIKIPDSTQPSPPPPRPSITQRILSNFKNQIKANSTSSRRKQNKDEQVTIPEPQNIDYSQPKPTQTLNKDEKVTTPEPQKIDYSQPKSIQTLKADAWVNSVAISADGKTFVSGGNDKTIKIWDLKTGQLQSTLIGHESSVKSVAISADGKTLVTGVATAASIGLPLLVNTPINPPITSGTSPSLNLSSQTSSRAFCNANCQF